MKKIMFNDRYGLTQAVIEGRKTMTRRIMNNQSGNLAGCVGFTKNGRACTYVRADFDNGISEDAPYAIGEIVAVAQRYQDIFDYSNCVNPYAWEDDDKPSGWTNKMLTKAELMPHQIRITGIKCERLYDISEADCLKEGVRVEFVRNDVPRYYYLDFKRQIKVWFDTPREAFASLIDKVSGYGTWQRNPWVVVYEFELVK